MDLILVLVLLLGLAFYAGIRYEKGKTPSKNHRITLDIQRDNGCLGKYSQMRATIDKSCRSR